VDKQHRRRDSELDPEQRDATMPDGQPTKLLGSGDGLIDRVLVLDDGRLVQQGRPPGSCSLNRAPTAASERQEGEEQLQVA